MTRTSAATGAGQQEWAAVHALYAALIRGEPPRAVAPPNGLRLAGDEPAYFDGRVAYSRYYTADPGTWTERHTVLIAPITVMLAGYGLDLLANRRARKRVEHLAAAGWREHSPARVVLTDRRVLINTHPDRTRCPADWITLPYDDILAVDANVAAYMLVLYPDRTPPVRLVGGPIPRLGVTLGGLLWPPDQLVHQTWLAPFSPST